MNAMPFTRGRHVMPRCALFLLLSLFALSCSSDDAGTDLAPDLVWETGPATTHTVENLPFHMVLDSATGVALLFPEGGTGTVTVAPITVPGAAPPFPGSGFMIEHNGTGDMRFLVTADDGDHPMLLGYSQMDGVFDEKNGGQAGWYAVPADQPTDGLYEFLLAAPFQTGKRAGTRISLGAKYYWFSQITASSTDAEKRMNLSLQTGVFIDEALASMSPTLASACQAKIDNAHHWRLEHDGNYYKGFWWRSLGSYGRLIKPTIHVRLNASVNTLAHETGHYLVHLMVGDDVQSTLEGQSPLLTDHGLRELMGRAFVVEDYAYYMQFLLDGKVETVDLHTPYDVLRDLWGKGNDMPSHEGFTACLLANLTRTSPVMREYKFGKDVHVPIIGLTPPDVCDIIALGATDVTQLVRNIETRLGASAGKLSVLCQRMGWAYTARGRFVDRNGQPLAGLRYRNVAIIDGKTYEAGYSLSTTGADGAFSISSDVCPGNSFLRVSNGTDSTDIPIDIDWGTSTAESVVLGDFVVDFQQDLYAKLRQCNTVSVHTENLWQTFGYPYYDSGTQKFNMSAPMNPLPNWNPTGFTGTWEISSPSQTATIECEFTDGGRTLKRIRMLWREEYTDWNTVHETEIILKELPMFHISWTSSTRLIRFQVRGKECGQHAEKYRRTMNDATAPVTTEYYDNTLLSVWFELR